MSRLLKVAPNLQSSLLIGVGGIGAGIVFELSGDHLLGRNESRSARLLDSRDYCKLHIFTHYVSVLLGAGTGVGQFRVIPIGKVGDDPNGHRLIREMAAAGMDTRFVEIIPDRPTLFSVCYQYPDGSGGNITTSESAASGLTFADIERAESLLKPASSSAFVLAAPEVPLPLRLHVLELGGRWGAFRLASLTSGEMEEAKRLRFMEQVDLIALNEDEAYSLIQCEFKPSSPAPFLERLADHLRAYNPNMQIVLSVGAAGAFAFDSEWTHLPAYQVNVSSTAGAGDALFGGTVAGLISGMRLPAATELGMLLACYSVTSPHTIHPGANVESLLDFAFRSSIPVSEAITGRISSGRRA